MEMRTFALKVQKTVKELLGEAYEVTLQEVQKNNGVKRQGLLIRKPDYNVSPTIYLDSCWEAYEGGVTFSEIIRRILQMYRQESAEEKVDMSFFRDFQQVKDRICYRLVNLAENEELLEEIPYVKFLDLAVCFYYAYHSETLGNGTILLYQGHMEMWNTSVTELMQLAQVNTPRLFPPQISSMENVLREFMEKSETEKGEQVLDGGETTQFFEQVPMQIISNSSKVYGAAAILYPGVLEKAAAVLGTDFYIFPSSVHEVILLPDSRTEDTQELRSIVREANRTQLEPEEILSDSLYYYSLQEHSMKIIE